MSCQSSFLIKMHFRIPPVVLGALMNPYLNLRREASLTASETIAVNKNAPFCALPKWSTIITKPHSLFICTDAAGNLTVYVT